MGRRVTSTTGTRRVCVYVCVCVCVSGSVALCLCVFVCLYVFLSVFLCVCMQTVGFMASLESERELIYNWCI